MSGQLASSYCACTQAIDQQLLVVAIMSFAQSQRLRRAEVAVGRRGCSSFVSILAKATRLPAPAEWDWALGCSKKTSGAFSPLGPKAKVERSSRNVLWETKLLA